MAAKSDTLFADAVATCGLTQVEAAAFLEVSLSTLQKWSRGTNPAPRWTIEKLGVLFYCIEQHILYEGMPEGALKRAATLLTLRHNFIMPQVHHFEFPQYEYEYELPKAMLSAINKIDQRDVRVEPD